MCDSSAIWISSSFLFLLWAFLCTWDHAVFILAYVLQNIQEKEISELLLLNMVLTAHVYQIVLYWTKLTLTLVIIANRQVFPGKIKKKDFQDHKYKIKF